MSDTANQLVQIVEETRRENVREKSMAFRVVLGEARTKVQLNAELQDAVEQAGSEAAAYFGCFLGGTPAGRTNIPQQKQATIKAIERFGLLFEAAPLTDRSRILHIPK